MAAPHRMGHAVVRRKGVTVKPVHCRYSREAGDSSFYIPGVSSAQVSRFTAKSD
jgi:hypothetical protein